jgi:hypothetical protein
MSQTTFVITARAVPRGAAPAREWPARRLETDARAAGLTTGAALWVALADMCMCHPLSHGRLRSRTRRRSRPTKRSTAGSRCRLQLIEAVVETPVWMPAP